MNIFRSKREEIERRIALERQQKDALVAMKIRTEQIKAQEEFRKAAIKTRYLKSYEICKTEITTREQLDDLHRLDKLFPIIKESDGPHSIRESIVVDTRIPIVLEIVTLLWKEGILCEVVMERTEKIRSMSTPAGMSGFSGSSGITPRQRPDAVGFEGVTPPNPSFSAHPSDPFWESV